MTVTDVVAAWPSPTEEQTAVIRQPADALVLVTAGAGSGKTHTLVRRLEHLLEEERVAPADVLVLSFSRAAVNELRRRAALGTGSVVDVPVRTFDSWALEILHTVESDTDWGPVPFDERVRRATAAIGQGLADDMFEYLRHVVIDEVQDLVDARRELVLALLTRFDCGFTLVGDPAQSINGFQVENVVARAAETGRFLDELRAHFADDLVELTLTRNFRAESDEARTALAHETEVRDSHRLGARTAREFHRRLRDSLLELYEFGDLEVEYVQDMLRDQDMSTAVLCRYNVQAYVISELLADHDIPHRLRRRSQDRVAPAWIDTLVRGVGGPVLTRSAFEAAFSGQGVEPGTDPNRVWRSLRACASDPAGVNVLVDRLRAAVGSGRLPDDITSQPEGPLVVSSFHRAKGLEFDRVLVTDTGDLDDERDVDLDPAEEARVLYVAMTRARRELYRLERPVTTWIRTDRRTGRIARFGPNRFHRRGLEIVGGDVDRVRPPGTWQFDADAVELQEYIAGLPPGAPLEFVRHDGGERPDGDNEDDGPHYVLTHQGRAIAVASDDFRRALRAFLTMRGLDVWWPRRIHGLRLDCVETVHGSDAAGANAGLGSTGLWLAPRPFGLSRFEYDRPAED